MVDISLGEHGVVLKLRSAEGWAVGRNQQQLSLTSSQSLQGTLQTESVLARLDHELQSTVDGFSSLSGLLGGHSVKLTKRENELSGGYQRRRVSDVKQGSQDHLSDAQTHRRTDSINNRLFKGKIKFDH